MLPLWDGSEREYQMRGKKVAIERKEDLKKRLGRSPDYADSCAILIDLAVTRGLVTGQGTKSGTRSPAWKRLQRRANALYDDELAQQVIREEQMLGETDYRYSRFNPRNRRRYVQQPPMATFENPGF